MSMGTTIGTINWTKLLIILLTILVALVLVSFTLWIVFHFAADLLLLVVAAILASLLHPIVQRVQRGLGLPRPACILLVYLTMVLLLIVVGLLFVPAIVEQARALQERLPGLLRQVDVQSGELERFLRQHGIRLPVRDVASNAANAVAGAGPAVLGGVLNLAAAVGAGLLNTVLVLVMTFYLIKDHATIGRTVAGVLPGRYAAGAAFAGRSASAIMGRYVRAQLAVATMVAVLGGGGAAVLGVPYAPLIGIVAFLAESIPVLGPIIATVPAVLIALVESPWKALAVLIWFVVVQQLEQNVIMPRLSGHAVGIHPVAAIMAVLIGFSLGSIWGALFAVPLLGFVVALVREAWRVYVLTPAAGTAPAGKEERMDRVGNGV